MDTQNYALAGLSALKLLGVRCLQDVEIQKEFRIYRNASTRDRSGNGLSSLSLIEYPDRSFGTYHGINVSAPELAFIQSAKYLTIQQLIFLGCEMCSHKDPVSSFDKLNEYISKAHRCSGKLKADRALRYVVPGSSSCAETSVGLALSLPPLLGGHGLPKFEFNKRVEIPKSLIPLAKKPYYILDIAWMSRRVIVEYDSDQWHIEAGAKKLHDDSVRKEILQRMGYKVYTATSIDLGKKQEMADLAQLLALELKMYKFKKTQRQMIFFPKSF